MENNYITCYAKTIAVVSSIIKIYTKKQLNVSKNLFLFMKYDQSIYGLGVEQQINYYKRHIDNINDYLPEINKYLLFS